MKLKVQNFIPPMGTSLEDQIDYIGIKFKSFSIEINYLLTQLTDQNTNNGISPSFFDSMISAVFEFMVNVSEKSFFPIKFNSFIF